MFFEESGYRVSEASSVVGAKVEFARHEGWAIIVSDYHLSDGTGLAFHNWIQEQVRIPPPFLLMSGRFRGEAVERVKFLAKPFELAELRATVEELTRDSAHLAK